MYTEDRRLKAKTKKKREEEYKKYEEFPVINILINFRNFPGDGRNGARIISTEPNRPCLAIQSDGRLAFLQNKANLCKFVMASVRLATDSTEGKMPRLEAYRSEPPIRFTSFAPFNPVYRGLLNDCDDDTFYGEETGKTPAITSTLDSEMRARIKQFLTGRPEFSNL